MKVTIAGLSERDIDLLLAEECIANAALRAYLLNAAGLPQEAADASPDVQRGVTHSTGESDLVLDTLLANGERACLLIENKVDAALQYRQSERYAERAASIVTAGRCDVARTVIIAPARYFSDSDTGFDCAITYEDLIAVLRESPAEPARLAYRMAVLTAAIEKSTLGYQRRADEEMVKLWREYGAIVAELSPELNPPSEQGRPSGSHFVYFQPDGFPKPIQLIHKFAYGRLDLQFPGWGPSLSALRERLHGMTPPGFTLVRAGKSAALRLAVPVVSVAAAKAEREAATRTGVLAAKALLAWSRANQVALEALRVAPPSPEKQDV